MIYDVIVIGAGASGCFAAIQAGYNGKKVLLLERNEKIGKKLYITGKGRCNVTNYSEPTNHLNNIINGKKFMNSAARVFTANDTIDFFENKGVELKVERGNRVFPCSDKSSDIIKALEKEINNLGIEIKFNTKVNIINKKDDIFNIKCDNKENYTSNSVVLATGGKSYSATGSDGFGYHLAKKFGHTIVEPKPSLVPIILNDKVKDIEGLSLKNVNASIEVNSKVVATEFGEMLFTDNGVSGPIVLTMSTKINRLDLSNAKFVIDFKPALSYEFLDKKLVTEFNENSMKMLSTYLKTLLPSSLIPKFISKLGFEDKKLAQINKEERKIIVTLLKRFDFSIKMLDNIDNAIVTSGGVCLDEVNPKTMESKLVSGLYFVGELLDVDALTGGYNLQVAFSTGYVAGYNIK